MAADDGSQRVCCCEVDTWAKTIAWIETLFFGFSIVAHVYYLTVFLTKGATKVLKTIDNVSHPVLAQHADDGFGVLIAIIVFLLILSLIGLFMAILLRKGVEQAKPTYLMRAIIFNMACQALLLVWLVSQVNGENIPKVLLTIVTSISVVSFGMSLVYTLKLDIEKEQAEAEAENEGDGGAASGEP